MKKIKKRWTGLFLALACLMSLLLAAPVQAAELSDSVVAQLQNEVQMFLMPGSSMGDFFNLTEETYDEMRDYGGFYEAAVDAWRDNRDETGGIVSLGETSVEIQDETGMIQCVTPAEFENYSGEVIISFTADDMYPSDFVINVDYPLSKSLEEAGVNTATGLIIVFIILFFLCGVIYLIRYVNPAYRGKKEDVPSRTQTVQSPAPERPEMPAAPVQAAPAEDIELAIVLAAAIAAAEAEQPSGDGYVAVSYTHLTLPTTSRV